MLPLSRIIERLAEVYGEPAPPPSRTLLDLVLFENAAHLVDDEHRSLAFRDLQTQIGVRPEQILAASEKALIAAGVRASSHKIRPQSYARSHAAPLTNSVAISNR